MEAVTLATEEAPGVYPEKAERNENAFDRWTRTMSGQVLLRFRPFHARIRALAEAARELEPGLKIIDDEQLRARMRARARDAMRGHDLASALALVREAAVRSLGLEPFDAQLMGTATLMSGKLAEMQTGEGKTLTAALAACIAAAANTPVHVVTVNDYLAERDAGEMGPLFRFLGLSVGVIVTGMSPDDRRTAYACNITYCTNKELVFDYLKDRVAAGGRSTRAQLQVQALLRGGEQNGMLLRGLHFAIIDEADSIMIDEARTPLILGEKGPAASAPAIYRKALDMAGGLESGVHYEILAERRHLHLTPAGKTAIGERSHNLDPVWQSARAREHLVSQALRALYLFHRDQQYLVDAEDKVQIIDEYTGRVLPGRTWEQGLHQMIEVKEGCPLSEQNRTLARITYQRFFPRYLRLSGMTGTAREVASELYAVYGLEVVPIPTNKPGRRILLPSVCLPDENAKWLAVAAEAEKHSARGAPVLVGTRSLEASERLSAVLTAAGLPHRLLNARQDAEEADIVGEAGQWGRITVATNMAGRGTDIRLGRGVHEVGGLHVILTEYHDSPRIDRQLIGRCARQGDQGTAVAIVAQDDELFVRNGGWLLSLLKLARQANWSGKRLAMLRWAAQRNTSKIQARERQNTLNQDRSLDTMLAFAGNQI